MNNGYNEEARVNTEESEGSSENEYAYKKVIKDKHQRRTWSVVSLALAALSILFIFIFSYVGLVLALLSVGAALISRKNLGYFDKLSLYAMIAAIFGGVFSLVGICFGDFISQLFA